MAAVIHEKPAGREGFLCSRVACAPCAAPAVDLRATDRKALTALFQYCARLDPGHVLLC
jgi:hypothetical protein